MENTGERDEEGKALVTVLSCVLNRLIQANNETLREGGGDRAVTRFHALKPPSISVYDYLQRILKYSSCSNECFVLALIYIDRLIQGNNLALSALNVHRVVITSIMIAVKFFDDQYFNNAYYAKIGGVTCSEINSLETEFLFRVNFSLHVDLNDFITYRNQLSHHARQGGRNCSCSFAYAHIIAPLPVPISGGSSSSNYALDHHYADRRRSNAAGYNYCGCSKGFDLPGGRRNYDYEQGCDGCASTTYFTCRHSGMPHPHGADPPLPPLSDLCSDRTCEAVVRDNCYSVHCHSRERTTTQAVAAAVASYSSSTAQQIDGYRQELPQRYRKENTQGVAESRGPAYNHLGGGPPLLNSGHPPNSARSLVSYGQPPSAGIPSRLRDRGGED